MDATDGDMATCRIGAAMIIAEAPGARVGQTGWLSVRPERIALSAAPVEGAIQARISQTVYLGTDTQALADLGGGVTLRARAQNALHADRLAEGADVHLAIAPGAARFLEA